MDIVDASLKTPPEKAAAAKIGCPTSDIPLHSFVAARWAMYRSFTVTALLCAFPPHSFIDGGLYARE